MHIAVIGAGMAGCAAALEARACGAEVDVFYDRPGATSSGGGLFDLAPLHAHQTIEDGLRSFLEHRKHHPYAVLFEDPAGTVVAEATRFLGRLPIFQTPDFTGSGKTVPLADASVRLTSALQRGIASFEPGQVIGIGDWRSTSRAGLQAWSQAFGARVPECSFVPVPIEFFERSNDLAPPPNGVLDPLGHTGLLDRLAESIRRSVGAAGIDLLLLPVHLGEAESQVASLAERSGVLVGELADTGGGVQGLRLDRAIVRTLEDAGCEVMERHVEQVEPAPESVLVSVESDQLAFDSVVIGAGTAFGGGLAFGSRGPHCPLVDAAVHTPVHTPPGALAPHVAGGLRWDVSCRVLDADGSPWSERVFAAGSVLYGVDPVDGSGYGACVMTGLVAGRRAAGVESTFD